MGTYTANGTKEVVALQYLASDTELDKVNLHDWIHDVDSSTIYGAVAGGIMKELEKYGGFNIPGKHDGEYIHNKALALDGDWIIKHDNLVFTVMTDAVFKSIFNPT